VYGAFFLSLPFELVQQNPNRMTATLDMVFLTLISNAERPNANHIFNPMFGESEVPLENTLDQFATMLVPLILTIRERYIRLSIVKRSPIVIRGDNNWKIGDDSWAWRATNISISLYEIRRISPSAGQWQYVTLLDTLVRIEFSLPFGVQRFVSLRTSYEYKFTINLRAK
jgi:hypothetical protein